MEIKRSTFKTNENESRLRVLVESLAVHGRQVRTNGNKKKYIIEYHDSQIPAYLREVSINGKEIKALLYGNLIEGALRREDIAFELCEENILL